MTPLAGRSVVVTRASEQAGGLAARLRHLGAEVVEVPTIAIVDPLDGGAALRAALAGLRRFAWVVVTSPNGAERLARALADSGTGTGSGQGTGTGRLPPLAVVGPGTAAACEALGLPVALVPERFVAEGLVEAFPAAPAPGPDAGPQRVLVAQAEAARPVLVDGLRAKGWDVHPIVAYRTVAAEVPGELAARAVAADAVTFTSGSTVRAYVAALPGGPTPQVVVCIGPVTADAARAVGLCVTTVAETHDLDGLVAAVVKVLG